MAYSRGKNSNIIVGAAALYVTNLGTANYSSSNAIPLFAVGQSYKDTLSNRQETFLTLFLSSILAPWSTRVFIASECPFSAAKCKGVLPT